MRRIGGEWKNKAFQLSAVFFEFRFSRRRADVERWNESHKEKCINKFLLLISWTSQTNTNSVNDFSFFYSLNALCSFRALGLTGMGWDGLQGNHQQCLEKIRELTGKKCLFSVSTWNNNYDCVIICNKIKIKWLPWNLEYNLLESAIRIVLEN